MYDSSNLFGNSQSSTTGSHYAGRVESKPSRYVIRLILNRECDKRDLLALYHVGHNTKIHGQGSDVSDLMTITGLSNPATNVRLRKLSGDLKAGALKIPLLQRRKTGAYGSHLYFLNEDIGTLEDLLEDLKAVMASKGINYEQHITQLQEEDLRVVDCDDTLNEEEGALQLNKDKAESSEDDWADSLDDLSPEDSCNSEEASGEKENPEIKQPELTTDDSASNCTDNSKQGTSSNDANLSRTVTLGEVLKIIDAATEIVVEQFAKEIAKRDERISELERLLASYQDSRLTSTNHTAEILDTVRSSVLSKFGEFSSKKNGKAHN